MSARIHPTALVDASAEFGADVNVGPFAIIGPRCVVGDGSTIAARATLEQNVKLGRRVHVGIGAIIVGDPQDLKYQGEETWVSIGDDSAVREYATVNRGTAHSITTTIGRHCFIMSYSHVAQDCHIGDHVIISNGTQLAGHVTIAFEPPPGQRPRALERLRGLTCGRRHEDCLDRPGRAWCPG